MRNSWLGIATVALLFCVGHAKASTQSTKKRTSSKKTVAVKATAKSKPASSADDLPPEMIIDPIAVEIEKEISKRKEDPRVQEAVSVKLWSLKDPPKEKETEQVARPPLTDIARTPGSQSELKTPAKLPPLVRGHLTASAIRESANGNVSIKLLRASPESGAAPVIPPKLVASAAARRPIPRSKEFKIALKPSPAPVLVARAKGSQRRPASVIKK
jgi:hypothetical protein